MFEVLYLSLIAHRRKKHILWLIVSGVIVFVVGPMINSLSLGQWWDINTTFQHQATEIIGVMFILYFGSLIFQTLRDNKTLQLLWAKKKQPTQMLAQLRWGIFVIYSGFVIMMMIASMLTWGRSPDILIMYINLLITWAITLSLVMLFSLFTNSYASMIVTLVIYLISYSINFILFGTPNHFQWDLSYKLLTIVQYFFPRFDLLYSTIMTSSRFRTMIGTIIYGAIIAFVLYRVFLSRYQTR